MTSPALILWSLSLLAAPAADDPRVELVEFQLARQYSDALARTEEMIASDPALADDLWLRYLRGHLLDELGRDKDAHEAFAQLLGADSELAAYARLRMARMQAEMGHPEVAAGLVATLLGSGAPPETIEPAARLLVETLAAGADCRLLGRLDAWQVPEQERRRLQLALAGCIEAGGDSSRAAVLLLELLHQDTDDLVGRDAALRLSRLPGPLQSDPQIQLLVGMAFHHNREFERSTSFLERGLANLDPEQLTIPVEDMFGYRYANARGYFWLRRYPEAAVRFNELAARAHRAELAADCLYQAGRSLELEGHWTQAATTFRRAYLADRSGEWAGAALLSALRIEFRTGKEGPALELFGVLSERAAWRGLARRAALFLSASDLVRGRADRAAIWLRRSPGEAAEEFLYWRGRTAEFQGSPELAIRHYLELLRNSTFHPLADAARLRLIGDELQPLLGRVARQLASTGRRADLHSAWLLYGDDSSEGQLLRSQLEQLLLRDARSGPYLSLALIQPPQWPLWQAAPTRAGERFLRLGIWSFGEPHMVRSFPVSQPSLAFTGSSLLAHAGMVNRSLHLAEIMALRVPGWTPPQLLPEAFRQLLYPYPYRQEIGAHSERFGVEPELLAALIREESRFDPAAVSAASARGLTQFVYSTAAEMAPVVGVRDFRPEHLHDANTSIAMGAAYLARLLERFDQRLEPAITAYNAGEEQVRVWQSYCYSRDPAEYYSKVGFPQTRGYLRKVVSSRNQYRDIYVGS